MTIAGAVTAGSVHRIRCLGAEPLSCCQGGRGRLQLFYPLRRRRGGAGGGGSGSRVRGGGGGGYAVMDHGSSPRGGAVSGGARDRGVGYLAPPSSTLGGRLGQGVSLGGRAGPGGQAGRGAGHGVGRGEVTAGRRRRGVARARVPYIVCAIVEGNHSLPWRISCMILKDSLSGNGRPAFSARSVAATTCFINPSGIRSG